MQIQDKKRNALERLREWRGAWWASQLEKKKGYFYMGFALYMFRLWEKKGRMVSTSLLRASHPLARGASSHHQQWLLDYSLPKQICDSLGEKGREKWQGHLRNIFGSISNVILEWRGFACKALPNNFREVSEGQIAQERTDAITYHISNLRCSSWETIF